MGPKIPVMVWSLPVILLALRWRDISLAHSVECWTSYLEALGSNSTWSELSHELFISTFLLFPFTIETTTKIMTKKKK